MRRRTECGRTTGHRLRRDLGRRPFAIQALAIVVSRSDDPIELPRLGRNLEIIGTRVFMPALTAQRSAQASSLASEPKRVPAAGERDARLEGAPIGTVEYLPLETEVAISAPHEYPSEP